MKIPSAGLAAVSILSGALLSGCGRADAKKSSSSVEMDAARPLAAALVPEAGEGAADREIRRCQERVRTGNLREAWIERLGWAFVAKAHESFDPGYYKLAEVCADALGAARRGTPEELLLRGHVLDSLHRFKDAEPLARELVVRRGLSFDYELLGDTLMEQGRIAECIPVYQKAMDLRPDLQAYSRAAQVRWLTGDLAGAIEMMKAAVGASSPVDPASVAWTCTRLAALQLQAGDEVAARQAGDAALHALPGYPPALLLRGKMQLAAGDASAALVPLDAAVKASPLPESQWALADALRASGRAEAAAKIEARLETHGAVSDPRTLSLFLATRGRNMDLAVRLAERELRQREDVFTHDALAWALTAAGRMPEAMAQMDEALGAGTDDARLFFHAAVIAARTGNVNAARGWVDEANTISQTLMPSEREQLRRLTERLSTGALPDPSSAAKNSAAGKPKPKTSNKS